MSRPLIVSDCDEVLLHMVSPFRSWLDEAHGIEFSLAGNDFSRALRRRTTGMVLEAGEVWPLLDRFFEYEMHRQAPIAGAVEAMRRLSELADVVVLTNLTDRHREPRARQLAEHGLGLRVFTNQGPKGPALKAILDEYQPSRAVFIDDLAQHHGSVAELTPEVLRLHMCGEPLVAPHIACAHAAGHAHARIDDWASALPWLVERLNEDSR
ncbi:MAG: HAD family hydrolase [Novosphingobium sp.]|nr:HAD family hydrolase [Novosphingobium sp.]